MNKKQIVYLDEVDLHMYMYMPKAWSHIVFLISCALHQQRSTFIASKSFCMFEWPCRIGKYWHDICLDVLWFHRMVVSAAEKHATLTSAYSWPTGLWVRSGSLWWSVQWAQGCCRPAWPTHWAVISGRQWEAQCLPGRQDDYFLSVPVPQKIFFDMWKRTLFRGPLHQHTEIKRLIK